MNHLQHYLENFQKSMKIFISRNSPFHFSYFTFRNCLWGYLLRLGSGPVSLKNCPLRALSRTFINLLKIEITFFRSGSLMDASIFQWFLPYFTFVRSHSNCQIFIFINKGNCITFFCLASTCSKFGLSRFCCVFRISVWLTSYLLRSLTVKCRMLSVVSVKSFQT